MKRIVVCCDGTRGKYDAEDKNTNVVRLFERLGQDGPGQISYYDPGVGTHSPLRNGTIGLLDKLVASASGMGITSEGLNDNVRGSLPVPDGLLRTRGQGLPVRVQPGRSHRSGVGGHIA